MKFDEGAADRYRVAALPTGEGDGVLPDDVLGPPAVLDAVRRLRAALACKDHDTRQEAGQAALRGLLSVLGEFVSDDELARLRAMRAGVEAAVRVLSEQVPAVPSPHETEVQRKQRGHLFFFRGIVQRGQAARHLPRPLPYIPRSRTGSAAQSHQPEQTRLDRERAVYAACIEARRTREGERGGIYRREAFARHLGALCASVDCLDGSKDTEDAR